MTAPAIALLCAFVAAPAKPVAKPTPSHAVHAAAPAEAAGSIPSDVRPWVGDPVNGRKLYDRECGACHGEAGSGGRSGVRLTESGRMNLLQHDALYAAIATGGGIQKEKEHKFAGKLSMLDLWDVVAYMGTLYMPVGIFFQDATHYVAKEYTIDEHGLKRIEDATTKRPGEKTGGVFTFFKKDSSDAVLEYVTQDPIKLDQLKKKEKVGYLVFVPVETKDYSGELGIAMDAQGKLLRLMVHDAQKGGAAMNSALASFAGLGKKGQKEPFKIEAKKPGAAMAPEIFARYLIAMELATMYDRDELERTWAEAD